MKVHIIILNVIFLHCLTRNERAALRRRPSINNICLYLILTLTVLYVAIGSYVELPFTSIRSLIL